MAGIRNAMPNAQTEEDLSQQATWQLQLRWFSSMGILEIRLRWLAGAGVLFATWLVTSILLVPLPPAPLYLTGLCILAYNGVLQLYLQRRFSVPSRAPGYDYSALVRYFWGRLEEDSASVATGFDRFVKIQTSLDWLAMISLVHFTGGVESPLLFFFVFHLITASILLAPRACYFFAATAAVAVAVLSTLEYTGVIPHVSTVWSATPLYQNGLYVTAVLFFFTTSLFVSAYLAVTLTTSLRQRGAELLRTQKKLTDAYQLIQTLYQVTRTVSSTLDLDKVLRLIARNAVEAMSIKACAIVLVERNTLVASTVASYGLSDRYLAGEPKDVRHSRYIYETFASGHPAILYNNRDDRLDHPERLREEGIESVLCVPLVIRGRTEGVTCVYCTELDRFDTSDAEFLSALANAGATAIENARAYQGLEMADRAKSDFVRMVTHEFRSPLAAVQSMLTLIEDGIVGPVNPKQEELIERAQRRIDFMLALVRDLLELAAGKMELLTAERKAVNLSKIVAKVTELMQSSAEAKELAFTVEVSDEHLVLTGFEDGLERVLMNLVSNAIKYTPAKGSVTVRAWSEEKQIGLEVSDTGIGIPAEALPLIFTEFYRAKNAKAVDVEGTGLGLVITRDVVEQHGGQISVESVEGEGSIFHVILPKA